MRAREIEYFRSADPDQLKADVNALLIDARWRLVAAYWDGIYHVALLEFES